MHKPIHINPALPNQPRVSVLVIYTGGTLGMVYDRTAGNAGQLIPFDVEQVLERMPEIHRLDFEITLITLDPVLDSSNISPGVWVELARLIEREYARFDSFVILHGTDTMAYTASALSFMLGNLSKPVILTGAQLPIGAARTDARENFITALEIAAAVDTAAQEDNQPMVPEVCVYFNARLLRGNRATKQESVHFNAFASENYPHLAQAGVTIDYNRPFIHRPELAQRLTVHTELDTNVTILKLFPGITEPVVRATLGIPGLRGLVLETFGAGNAPTATWFLDALREAIERGLLMMNVSQCEGGRVTQGQYQSSTQLRQIGVVSGADITTEAAITKLMFVLGQSAVRPGHKPAYWQAQLAQPICGEMTTQSN